MTKYLSTVLDVNDSQFARRIALLEQASLGHGLDIRLTTSIRSEVKQKIALLGLDPNDTTAVELYHALQQKVHQGDAALKIKFGLKDSVSSVQMLQAVAKNLQPYVGKQTVWAIKKSSLKKILASVPARKTMKLLHYRSDVSMLKREQATELYALAYLLEGPTYQEKIKKALKQLKPSDFEERQLEIICFSQKRWEQVKSGVRQQTVPVYSLSEIACVVVLPVKTDKTDCLVLLAVCLLLKETKHIKEHASYLKIKTLDPHLHLHVQVIAEHGKIPMFTLHGDQVYWHHVHRVVGKRKDIPEDFHPHMTSQDMQWLTIEAQLATLANELDFWVGTHRLAFASDLHTVSFHILDVTLAAMYHLSIDQISNVFVKESIQDELIEEYLQKSPFSRLVDDHVYKLTDTKSEISYTNI